MGKYKIKKLILRAIEENNLKEDIKSIRLFGSYSYGKPNKDSDVDLLVEFSPKSKVGFFRLVNIQNIIEKYVGKKIDLQTPDALSKYFRSDVFKKAEPVYGK
ncbi:nucleotidyltransferase domain-containing protein [Candidatus Saganbacteria bacterium]|nr:nucleotidyltransferase domain-containing protein [Candidatus Saganbacteria bacterium]